MALSTATPTMNTMQTALPSTAAVPQAATRNRIPLAVKIAYTAFMAVLVPVYWTKYGPTNFLYFCDVALFLTLVGLWTESSLLISMPAVGILLPQTFWCLDFGAHLLGAQVTGMTNYMFDPERSLFLRGLSFFHGWLPFLLVYGIWRLGYDRRAWLGWGALAAGLCVFCFLFMPPAAPEFAGKLTPNNINYVWGMDDSKPQSWMPAPAYLVVWIGALFTLVYTPTHLVLARFARHAR